VDLTLKQDRGSWTSTGRQFEEVRMFRVTGVFAWLTMALALVGAYTVGGWIAGLVS
jgi:hypothetical protein